ncbi:unnamed protein product [Protopolystoma xenopodis]|uniref:Uncharacterized protein n=1 Tax=Protopolystoma xenopodis TaxID=117903 RepID=A0A448WEW6_9PLAT|nr:unnamed protein product [Protopolystoma xenopodis]
MFPNLPISISSLGLRCVADKPESANLCVREHFFKCPLSDPSPFTSIFVLHSCSTDRSTGLANKSSTTEVHNLETDEF